MKILGEKSLSSKVEKGLNILFFVITLLDIIVLGVAGITLFSEFNSSTMRDNYLFKIVLEAVISFIFIATGIVALFIIYQFIKIFTNLKESKLFEKKNTNYLNKVSSLSIIIGFLYLICLVGISIFLRNYNSLDLLTDFLIKTLILVFSVAFFIFGIGIKILNEVYKKAIEYKEENDFTI